jgi:hypothetical protein
MKHLIDRNMCVDGEFVQTLAELEGRVRGPSSEQVIPREKKDLTLYDFSYTGFAMVHMHVGTNAVPDGGDSGHGFLTKINMSVEAGDFTIETDGTSLSIIAGGCDEAFALARLFELAGVALRQQVYRNAKIAEEGD